MVGDKQRIKQDAVFLLRAAGKSWKEIQIATDLSYQTVRRYFHLALEEQLPKKVENGIVNPLIRDQISLDELLN